MFEKINVWYIACRTGCSCCSYENFNQGFYKTEKEALEVATKWSKGIDNPLASQYAKYGRYRVVKCDAEVLPDGRMIVDEYKVYDLNYFGKGL